MKKKIYNTSIKGSPNTWGALDRLWKNPDFYGSKPNEIFNLESQLISYYIEQGEVDILRDLTRLKRGMKPLGIQKFKKESGSESDNAPNVYAEASFYATFFS